MPEGEKQQVRPTCVGISFCCGFGGVDLAWNMGVVCGVGGSC